MFVDQLAMTDNQNRMDIRFLPGFESWPDAAEHGSVEAGFGWIGHVPAIVARGWRAAVGRLSACRERDEA